MPALITKACAKSILFGEHAVVYGYPALAVPLSDLQLQVTIIPDIFNAGNAIRVIAPTIGLNSLLCDIPDSSPIRKSVELTLDQSGVNHIPACTIRIESDFPAAGGLGSSAACAIALIRAVSNFLGSILPLNKVNEIAFEIEKMQHGNPSGIDNTVITYQKPVFYLKEQPIEFIAINKTLHLILAYCGIQGKTKEAVDIVRSKHSENNIVFDGIFMKIGKIVINARDQLATGDLSGVGKLMIENHHLLKELGVSIPSLDELVHTAVQAGALGAKLCGGGLGGNIVALAEKEKINQVSQALESAGAVWVHSSLVNESK